MKTSILVLALIACIAVLVSGQDALGWPLPGGLPFGNLISAAIVILPGLISMRLSPPSSRRRALSALSVGLGLCWLPVSIALAGNLELNFSGLRGELWIMMTAGITSLVLGWLLVVTSFRFLEPKTNLRRHT